MQGIIRRLREIDEEMEAIERRFDGGLIPLGMEEGPANQLVELATKRTNLINSVTDIF